MIYSDLYTKSGRQVPTSLALIVIIISVVIFGRLSLDIAKKRIKASEQTVQRFEITNLTSNGVTLYWQSKEKEKGSIIFGELPSKLNQAALDERDLTIPGKYRNHFVTLKNLKKSTTFYFKVLSNQSVVPNLNGEPFVFKTLADSKDSSNLRPAVGEVINESGAPQENVAVIIHFENAYPLSTYTKGSSGKWVKPLINIRSLKTGKLLIPAAEERVKLEFISESPKNSTVTTTVSQLNPLPKAVVIGKNYNFLPEDDRVLSSSVQKTTPIGETDILFPKENAIVPANNPLVKGVAIPNSNLTIAFRGGEKFSSLNKLNADTDGGWKLSLKNNLAPGKYSLTLQTKDKTGKIITKERHFTIAKSGESVLGESTPEAGLSPTTVSSLTPASAATLVPTQPVSGSGINPIFATSLSLVIIGFGLLLVF